MEKCSICGNVVLEVGNDLMLQPYCLFREPNEQQEIAINLVLKNKIYGYCHSLCLENSEWFDTWDYSFRQYYRGLKNGEWCHDNHLVFFGGCPRNINIHYLTHRSILEIFSPRVSRIDTLSGRIDYSNGLYLVDENGEYFRNLGTNFVVPGDGETIPIRLLTDVFGNSDCYTPLFINEGSFIGDRETREKFETRNILSGTCKYSIEVEPALATILEELISDGVKKSRADLRVAEEWAKSREAQEFL